jgi:hypothetical protein
MFYVYLLRRLDGRPCYVGKGKGERWRHQRGRNEHLLNIIRQAKLLGKELPAEKIRENLSEDEAFALERKLIAFYGREDLGTGDLVNLTDGGEGLSGYKPSPTSNAKRSAALKGREKTIEHVANAAAALRGSKKSSGWWSTKEGLAKQRQNNRSRFARGHKHSPETTEKLRAARFAQQNVSAAGQFKPGHQPSPETRAKMSASAAAAWAARKPCP